MPQLTPITLTAAATEFVYKPRSNEKGLTTFSVDADTLGDSASLSIGVRPVSGKQTTRKSSLKIVEPLPCVLDACGAAIDRSSNILNLDMTVSLTATVAERGLIYDKAVAALASPAIRTAFINNESFYG